ncbi:MAG: MucBP domain-containing protein [Coprobacillus sp.]
MKNNIVKTIKIMLLTCFVIFPLSLTNSYAAQYEVVFKGGANGTVNNQKSVTYTLGAGEIFPDEPTVKAKEGYVFTGWNKALPEVGTKVEGKQIYVAQYDVIIDGISYIVRYVDEQGVTIATAKTMMAESGSRITERAKTIPGYTYKTATQEFVVDKNNKEIKFEYILTNPEERIIYEEEVVNVVVPGQTTPGQATAPGQTNPDDNTTNIEDNNIPQGNGENNETIDDQEVPLAKGNKTIDNILLYGGVVMTVVLLIGGIIIIKRKKKQG